MKCFSCKEEVNEKSHYALSQNVCPFCGKVILTEEDHYFRKSIVEIMERHGIKESNVVNDILNDIVDLLEGPSPDEAKAAGIELVAPTFVGNTSPATIATTSTISEEPPPMNNATKLANKKPPKPISLRSSAGSISEKKMPSESMDLSDMEDDLGTPTPEEAAEIEAMVARGEIVFTSLH